ncbi:MAG: sugar phosphate isomerase/epimerase [Planctomycetaceae bacterium]|jgi:sugar phosphate isomerase/epimerase|nr:sugar phosphate isomerase/epimerase [Planctomycetaceae bacterium]
MKWALCNETFETWRTDAGFDFPRVFDYIKGCGYDGVEIAPFTMEPDVFHIPAGKRVEVAGQAKRAGLEITGLHWLLARTEGYYLTSPEPAIRQKTADYFLELIRLCADLNGAYMVLGSPLQRNLLPGVTKDQALEYAADTLSKTLPMLEKCGVRMALEPLAPKETNFMQTAAEGVELIRKIGEPERIALHLDCKAMSSESVPIPELIRRNREHLIYFHANDPNLQGPGFGELAFEPILQSLCDIGYDGWVSVEVFDYTPGIERLATESIRYLKDCFEKINNR